MQKGASDSFGESVGKIEQHSLQEEVYRRLRRLIFDRGLETEALKVRQLADEFGVSPMPVREALRRLEADGLVIFTPNRSIVLSKPSLKEVEGIFEVRLRLEPFAGYRAASRISTEDLRRLDRLRSELDDFSDGNRWRANNAEFHRTIVKACGIPKLVAIIDNLWLSVEPYRQYYISNHRLLEAAQAHHGEIAKSLRDKDGRAVQKVLEKHLISTLDAILGSMHRIESDVEGSDPKIQGGLQHYV